MKFLADLGIVVPTEIPSDDDVVPFDFTRLSNRDLGALHSRYAVRHSHAIFQVALKSTRFVHLRRDLRIAQSRFRILHDDEKRKNVVDAMMEDDEKISHLLDRIAISESEVKLLEAVAQAYEDIRNAASREMTRRISERAPTD